MPSSQHIFIAIALSRREMLFVIEESIPKRFLGNASLPDHQSLGNYGQCLFQTFGEREWWVGEKKSQAELEERREHGSRRLGAELMVKEGRGSSARHRSRVVPSLSHPPLK
ncbi:hypothetical protein B0H13DRAFT_1863071 [Mycena leptocephala]|nr:hypothetical protein B0H13DRAFT_1863071 [Mycena leptocephala]